MMTYIKGIVLHHGVGYVIVENNGIGYKIVIPETSAHELLGEVVLYTHETIRDDTRELFGFLSVTALELFWKLIGISGVGPRTAQKIIFSGSIETARDKIMAGDLVFLTSVPGVGKKTAQKIILELKGVLAQEPDLAVFDKDAVEALIGLGYSRKDSESMLSGIDADTTEKRIRAALKFFSK